MTEDDAKKHTCPLTFAAPQEQLPGGHPRAPGPWNCIGSLCMMWRWKQTGMVPATLSTDDGYCGLAGQVGAQ